MPNNIVPYQISARFSNTNNYVTFAQFNQTICTQVEKSFFDTAFGKIAEGALSTVGGDAVSLVLDLIFGTSQSPDAQMLNQISNQLSTLQGEVAGVAMQTDYDTAITNVQDQITGINKLLNNSTVSITSGEINTLITFLSPGEGASLYTDYSSCIDNLLNVTYCASIEGIISSVTSNKQFAFGVGNCQAASLNTQLLANPIGVYDYIQNHVNVSSTVAGLLLGVCITANNTYNYIVTNQESIIAKFASIQPTIASDISSVLSNTTMLSDISSLTANTFLPTLLGPSLVSAPSSLCGVAFDLVTKMCYNAALGSGQTLLNTNIAISNVNGNIVTDTNNAIGGFYWSTQYSNTPQNWWASFVNNIPSNILNLAGPNKGFLGFTSISSANYVYEITEISYFIMDTYKFNGTLPNFSGNQWEVLVKANGNSMVFLFINQLVDSGLYALANNHGLLESTQPGQYAYDPNNGDQFWTITLKNTP